MSTEIIETAPNVSYGASPIKKKRKRRRTKAEMNVIREAIYNTLEADPPMTVRQVFYRLVSAGVIEKTEGEYKGTVGRLLTDMRRERVVPFEWITDNTRWMRKPRTYSSVEAALQITAQTYRRALWENQPVYVEIWLEKEALAGVVYDITEPWDVALMVSRGYSSVTFLNEAAKAISAVGKPAYLYHFGDYDPSGVNINLTVERDLRDFSGGAEIHFERVAVTEAQIEAMELPTRPTKKTDSRSKNFRGRSVEVDAIPPPILRRLVESCITQHIDYYSLRQLRRAEAVERESVLQIAESLSQ